MGAVAAEERVDSLQAKLRSLPHFARELTAGGLAGAIGKTSVAPLERTKILIQTGKARAGPGATLMHILETEGVPGLYRGNVACCVRIVPYSAIAFSSYEFFRRQLSAAGHRKGSQRLSAGWDLLAGAASGATATLLTYPLDTLRTRLAWVTAQTRCGSASSASSSSSGCSTSSASSSASGRVAGVVTGASTHGGHGAMSNAAATAGLGAAGMGPGSAALAAAGNPGSAGHLAQQRRISHMAIYTLRTEGVTGLYRGLMPTLYGILPYAGLKFYFYALSKQWYKDVLAPSLGHTDAHVSTSEPSGSAQNPYGEHGQQRLPLPYMLVFGGVSGLLAQTLTFPLDVVRRQMQVAGLHGPSAGLTTFGTAAAIVKAGGVRGLFRGLSLNYIKVVPSTAIGFASYDMLKSYLDVKGNL